MLHLAHNFLMDEARVLVWTDSNASFGTYLHQQKKRQKVHDVRSIEVHVRSIEVQIKSRYKTKVHKGCSGRREDLSFACCCASAIWPWASSRRAARLDSESACSCSSFACTTQGLMPPRHPYKPYLISPNSYLFRALILCLNTTAIQNSPEHDTACLHLPGSTKSANDMKTK